MSLYNRKNSPFIWCKFSVNGELVQKSTGFTTRKEAKEFEARLKVEMLNKVDKPSKPVHTWEAAVEKYYQEKLLTEASVSDRSTLRWLHVHLAGIDISLIKRSQLADIGDIKLAEGVKPSTVNRMMKLIRAILNQAVVWEWLDKAPSVRMLPEPPGVVRFITREEADRLVAALPPYVAVLAEFSLQTGLRMHNATHLKWSELDLPNKQAWVNAPDAKKRKAIPVPLSDIAVELIRQQLFNGSEYVFPHNGKPLAKASRPDWYRALKAVGIKKFRWHDLRHTWASWHVQNGMPLHVLKEIGGWATYEQVLIYAHLGTKHLAEWVNLSAGMATQTATQQEQGAMEAA
jgi:integrase